ncbi:MAG: bifunctional glutamate N-acetyltransferase/amino-acid acetyltransferase ArgJ [Thermoanaerobaculia bacterium]
MKLPKGFLASGVLSGVRKRRPDLAILLAPAGATAAAIFTKNRFAAAPVILSRAALSRSGGRVRAAVVNSGCANALTGEEGTRAARRVRDRTARLLRCPPEEVFLASTGVIGVALPDGKIREALPSAIARLSATGLDAASRAILTTDAGPKVATATFRHAGRRGRIVGFAKGAGMIHPDMATMLAFLATDVAASPKFLRAALQEAAASSFHAISVDGDTSTNDSVLLLASGELGGPVLSRPGQGAGFREALSAVCRKLAEMIVRDGEGASRVMSIEIRGARSDREAKLAAHAVATSPLVKTALAGGDPNWGRILAAVGRSGARFSPKRVCLRAAGLALVLRGSPAAYRERDAAKIFSRETVPIEIVLGSGPGKASLMTCDLGHDYVSLNADYRT